MMPIGSVTSVLHHNKLAQAVVRMFGMSELHSRFRTRPLLAWARRHRDDGFKAVVEVGCGIGLNLFALSEILPPATTFYGFEMNEGSIAQAEKIAAGNQIRNVEFHVKDCATFAFAGKPDVVLLIDFLEHLEKPAIFLRDLKRIVDSRAPILISVPTPRYPKVFGRKFHESVGHVVDGYDDAALSALLDSAGFKIAEFRYNTGPITSLFCALYYRWPHTVLRPLRSVAGYGFALLAWGDIWARRRTSASLFAVAHAVP